MNKFQHNLGGKQTSSIYFIITTYSVSGAEKIVHFLASEIAVSSQVTVIVLTGESSFQSDTYKQNLLHINKNKPLTILSGFLRTAAIILRDPNAIVINSHMGHSIIFARFLSLIVTKFHSRYRFVETFHNSVEGPFLRKILLAHTESLAKAYRTAVSQKTKIDLHKYGYISKKTYSKMKVIHNALPPASNMYLKNQSHIPEEYIRALNNQDNFNFVYVGRLTEQKNPQRLIRCFKIINSLLPSSMLFIAGEGPLELEIKELITALDLESSVILLGKINWIPILMSKARLLLMLSRWEGLPLVILEAVSCGLPVVSTDVGGIGEIDSSLITLVAENSSDDEVAKTVVNKVRSTRSNQPMDETLCRSKYSEMIAKYEQLFYD